MAAATITVEDLAALDPNRPTPFHMEVNFGIGGFNQKSRAHNVIMALYQAVIADAERNGEAVGEEADDTTVNQPARILVMGAN